MKFFNLDSTKSRIINGTLLSAAGASTSLLFQYFFFSIGRPYSLTPTNDNPEIFTPNWSYPIIGFSVAVLYGGISEFCEYIRASNLNLPNQAGQHNHEENAGPKLENAEPKLK